MRANNYLGDHSPRQLVAPSHQNMVITEANACLMRERIPFGLGPIWTYGPKFHLGPGPSGPGPGRHGTKDFLPGCIKTPVCRKDTGRAPEGHWKGNKSPSKWHSET